MKKADGFFTHLQTKNTLKLKCNREERTGETLLLFITVTCFGVFLPGGFGIDLCRHLGNPHVKLLLLGPEIEAKAVKASPRNFSGYLSSDSFFHLKFTTFSDYRLT